METFRDEPVTTTMESLRSSCESQIRSLHHHLDSATTSFDHSLSSIRDTALNSVQSRGKYIEAKAKLREAEDDLVKAISVKNRKEAKRIALMDALTARRSRLEELNRKIHEQRAKSYEYDDILSQQYSASKEKSSQSCAGEVHEAIEWYDKVLGFRVEGGHGVRFKFKNISLKHPNEEFSFSIRHADDTYILLDCNPKMDDVNELILDLNRTNGLFKFVRIMRQKFQEVAARGVLPHKVSPSGESSVVSASAPSLSMSTDGSELSAKKYEQQVWVGKANRQFKKQNRGQTVSDSILSPESALQSKSFNNSMDSPSVSHRRSSRLMVRK